MHRLPSGLPGLPRLPRLPKSLTSKFSACLTAPKHSNLLLADKEKLIHILKAGPKDNHAAYNKAMDQIFRDANAAFCEEFFNDADVQKQVIELMIDTQQAGETTDHRIVAALTSAQCQPCLSPEDQNQLLARMTGNPWIVINDLGLNNFFTDAKRIAGSVPAFLERLDLIKVEQAKPELLSAYLSKQHNPENRLLTEAERYLNPKIVPVAGDGWCYLNSVFSGIILDCVGKPEALRDFATNLEYVAAQVSKPGISRHNALMQVTQLLRNIAGQGPFNRERALQLISRELGVIWTLATEIGGHIVDEAHNNAVRNFCDDFAPACGVTTEQARNLINVLERQDIHNIDRLTFSTNATGTQRNLDRVEVTIADAGVREDFIVALRAIETNIVALRRGTNPDVLDQHITNQFDGMVARMGYRAVVMGVDTLETVEKLQSAIANMEKRGGERPLYVMHRGVHYDLLLPNNVVEKEVANQYQAEDDMPPIYMPGCIVS